MPQAQANGLQIEYESFGREGDPALVLIHGLGCQLIYWPVDFCEALAAEGFRVIRFDNRDIGLSSKLDHLGIPPVVRLALRSGIGRPGQAPYGLEDMADDTFGLMDALGVDDAHVVGISMGGMVAQYLAHRHPRRVRSLTLLSSSPAFGLDGTKPDDWRAARLAPLDQGLEPADFAERVLRAIAGPGISDEAMDGQVAAMRRITADGLRRSIDCLVTHDTRPILAEIPAPTLCLVGALDEETPVAYSRHLASHLPHGTLEVVPGAGHLLNVEAPDAVNQLIRHHLETVEASE